MAYKIIWSPDSLVDIELLILFPEIPCSTRNLLCLKFFQSNVIFATLDAVQFGFQIRQSYLVIFEMVIVNGIGFYFAGLNSEKIAELIGKFRK